MGPTWGRQDPGGPHVCPWTLVSRGIILCMSPANERQRYNVTSSLIDWAHVHNDPWESVFPRSTYVELTLSKQLYNCPKCTSIRSNQLDTGIFHGLAQIQRWGPLLSRGYVTRLEPVITAIIAYVCCSPYDDQNWYHPLNYTLSMVWCEMRWHEMTCLFEFIDSPTTYFFLSCYRQYHVK